MQTSLCVLIICTTWFRTDSFSVLNENNKDLPMLNEDFKQLIKQSSSELYNGEAISSQRTKLWDDKLIPFIISVGFSSKQMAVIYSAMAEIEDKSCVQFRPRSHKSNYVYFNHVRNEKGCSSDIGQLGKIQHVNLTDECVTHKTVLHEILHVLGFYHEHNRYDRDNYVQILYSNMHPNSRFEFSKKRQPEIVDLKTSYDYRSITHYPTDAFSINGKNTIVPTKVYGIIETDGLSYLDVFKINMLYNCTDFLEIENTDRDDPTALHLAAGNGNSKVVSYLLNISHNIEFKDKYGRTALHLAAANGHTDIVWNLINSCANIEAKDKEGRRPLHVAASNGHTSIVSLLVNNSANLDAKDKYSWTPLHYAAHYGQTSVVLFLFHQGANIFVKANRKIDPLDRMPHLTALDLARAGNHTEIIDNLFELE